MAFPTRYGAKAVNSGLYRVFIREHSNYTFPTTDQQLSALLSASKELFHSAESPDYNNTPAAVADIYIPTKNIWKKRQYKEAVSCNIVGLETDAATVNYLKANPDQAYDVFLYTGSHLGSTYAFHSICFQDVLLTWEHILAGSTSERLILHIDIEGEDISDYVDNAELTVFSP